MKKYSMCYSKTDEDTILEDNHFIYGIIPWDSLETKKHIIELLNEKEKQVLDTETDEIENESQECNKDKIR